MNKQVVFGILGGFVAGAIAATLIKPAERMELLEKINSMSDDLCSRLADELETWKDRLLERSEIDTEPKDLKQ